MRLSIYSKDNIQLAETDRFEYNGEFMAIPFVTTTINSPVPVPFDIGGYLNFRGDVFRLSYAPAALKQARPETSGEAFVYENMKFTSILDDLTTVDFLDVVLYDNGIHYSSQPNFDFYGNAKDLADRIQANLDRIYKGGEKWTVTVHPQAVSEAKNISVNNIKCWQALALANSEFGLNFVARGRTITIGTEGIAVGKVFGYGKGKGLYDIRQTTNEDALIITRLRAYGSTRNLPYHYYNNLKDSNGNPYVSESVYIPNLMLPSFPYTIQDPKEVYIDSPNIAKYGIREGSVYFDGSNGTKEIFPSLEGMTASELAAAGISVSLPSGDNGALNECLGAENPTDDGVLHEGVELPAYFKIYLKDLGFDLSEKDSGGNLIYAVENVRLAMRSGMNNSREFDVVDVVKDTSLGYKRFIVECKRVTDTSTGMAYPNKNWKVESGDKLVILGISMPEPYVKAAAQRVLSEATTHLAANDETKYTYSPSVDSKFMAENPTLGDTIREGDIFLFEDTDLDIYGGVIIRTLKITYGNSIIPDYNVTLSNDKVASTLEKIQDAINGLSSGGNLSLDVDQIRSIVKTVLLSEGDRRYIRKDIDDQAHGVITFDQEIGSTIFMSGFDGKGWEITNTGAALLDSAQVRSDIFMGGKIGSPSYASGFTGWGWEIDTPTASGTVDNWTVRKSAKFYEMVYSQAYGLNSSFLVSDWNKIKDVTPLGSNRYRCQINDMEGEMFVNLRRGDIVRTQKRDGWSIRYFASVVESIGSDTFDLRVIEGEDAPQPGDYAQRIGNETDKNRQGLIYFTSSDDYAPYIDILDGVTSSQFTQDNTKVRIGNLRGIRVNGQPLDMHGIYINGGIFQHSTYYMEDGSTIEQQFSIMDGKLTSEIEGLRNDLSGEKGNILRNSSFASDLNYWSTTGNVHFIPVMGGFMWLPSSFYVDKESVSDIYRDGSRNVLRIRNNSLKQINDVLSLPEHNEASEDGKYTYSFSFHYKVLRAGTLTAGVAGSDLYTSRSLDVSDEYQQLFQEGMWDEQGDFDISFTGEILIYGATLRNDSSADALIYLKTGIEQSEERIKLWASKEIKDTEGRITTKYDSELQITAEQMSGISTKVDNINNTINAAGWITRADAVSLFATKTQVNGLESSVAQLSVQYDQIFSAVGNNTQGITDVRDLANKAYECGVYSQEQYSQTSNPWNSWARGQEFKHVGALWYNPSTKQTKRYIGIDGSNSWETVNDSAVTAASFVLQNKDKWQLVVANFDASGKPTEESGLLTTAYGNTLYAKKDGVISAINQTAEEIKIQASKINLVGATSIGNFTIDGGWFKCNSTTGNDVGYIDMKSPSTRIAFGYDLITANAGGGLTCTAIITNNRAAAAGGTAYALSLKALGYATRDSHAVAIDCEGGVRIKGEFSLIEDLFTDINVNISDSYCSSASNLRSRRTFVYSASSYTSIYLPSDDAISTEFGYFTSGNAVVDHSVITIRILVAYWAPDKINVQCTIPIIDANGNTMEENKSIKRSNFDLGKGDFAELMYYDRRWYLINLNR